MMLMWVTGRRLRMNRKKHTLIYEKVNLTQNLNTTPLDVTGLDGDSWDYMVEVSARGNGPSVNSYLYIAANNDTSANYRDYQMKGYSSNAQAYAQDATTALLCQNSFTVRPSYCRCFISGESDSERYFDVSWSGDAGGSTVAKKSIYWKNTADNLTSLQISDAYNQIIDITIRIYQIPKKANLDNYDLVEAVDFVAQDLNASPIVFSGLDGDSDGEYLVEWLGLSQFPQLQLNSITDYTVQELRNNNGTIQAQNYSETESWTYGGLEGCSTVDAVSGRKRLIKSTLSNRVFASQQFEVATWCNNTADEITSITFSTDVATTTDGSVKLYRRKSNKTIDPVPMETLVEYDIAGVDFSAGITITGLQGDRINGAMKVEFVGDTVSTNPQIHVRLNNDMVNYSEQRLTSGLTVVSAASSTPDKLRLGVASNTNVGAGVMWLYPRTGQNRPILGSGQSSGGSLALRASWWNNTVDEINRIDIFCATSVAVTGTIRISVVKGTKQASPSWQVTVN